jgi:hypothetical protein
MERWGCSILMVVLVEYNWEYDIDGGKDGL